MTRISNVDQVLMLLRAQLQRMSQSGKSRKSSPAAPQSANRRETAASRLEAIARTDGLSEDELARTLLGALLVDEFGEAPANDHKFQRMVSEVHRIITSDPQARKLLGEALEQVQAGARG